MHAAYVIGMSARNSPGILLKEMKKKTTQALLSYISTREVREALAFGLCSSALFLCCSKFPPAYITQKCTRRAFYFFNNSLHKKSIKKNHIRRHKKRTLKNVFTWSRSRRHHLVYPSFYYIFPMPKQSYQWGKVWKDFIVKG